MPSDQKTVLIIGGGVVGLCCAYYLAEQGMSVSIVERAEVGSGASYGNAGLIVPSLSIPLASPGVVGKALKWMFNSESPFFIKLRPDLSLLSWLFQFALASRKKRLPASIEALRNLSLASSALFDSFARILETNFGYEKKGTLSLYYSREGLESGVAGARLLEQFGLASEILDTPRARDVEPSVKTDVLGGIYSPQDSHLTPEALVRSLAEHVVKMGVTIHTNTEVSGFTVKRRTISAVKTNHKDFHPDLIVLAAGSWTSALAHSLRIALPMQPAKGYSFTTEQAESAPHIPLLLGEAKAGVTPMGNKLRIAGTLELSGFDTSMNPRRMKSIVDSISRYIVTRVSFDRGEMWSGFRPCTPDGLPVIGRDSRHDNLILATGHGMLGVTLGPITGKLVAQIACGQKPDVALDRVGIERFQ